MGGARGQTAPFPLPEGLDPPLKLSPSQANNALSETLIVSSYLADGRRRLVLSPLLLLLPGCILLYLVPTRKDFCFPL